MQVDSQHGDERPRNPAAALYQPSEATQLAGQTHGTGGREPAAESIVPSSRRANDFGGSLFAL